MAGVGGGRRRRASRRSRRRSRTKTPVSLINQDNENTPPQQTTKTTRRTAYPELARVINHQKCSCTPHRLQVAREPGRRRRRQRTMTNEGILDRGNMPTGTRTGPQIGSRTRKKRRQRYMFFSQGRSRTRADQTQGSRPRSPRRGGIDHTNPLYRQTH